jgi:hypothetical protein
MIAANSIQSSWFRFGRRFGRDRVFDKPSNAISLAAAIFPGVATVKCNTAIRQPHGCPATATLLVAAVVFPGLTDIASPATSVALLEIVGSGSGVATVGQPRECNPSTPAQVLGCRVGMASWMQSSYSTPTSGESPRLKVHGQWDCQIPILIDNPSFSPTRDLLLSYTPPNAIKIR